MILAGDIGGTNTRLRLREDGGGLIREEVYPSTRYSSLEAVLEDFLAEETPRVSAACFGVAGPVEDQRCEATNLAWVVDAAALSRGLGGARVELINDLVAMAQGAVSCDAAELISVQGELGPLSGKHMAVIAAGTGLGEAALVWTGDGHVPMATEGGHADFAPRCAKEQELLSRAWEELGGHVSYERFVSGPGIVRISALLAGSGEEQRSAHEIVERGLQGDPRCAETVQMFLSLYGAEAGNLVLKTGAWGGLYVGGSIALTLLPWLPTHFLPAFRAKGRFSGRMASVPIVVLPDSLVGLRGAEHRARQLAESSGAHAPR